MLKNEKKFKVVVESALPERENSSDANNFAQRVEKKAYELYVKRGFAIGHDWEDWLDAEKAVETEMSTVDRDCIRSESFYKASHRPNLLPSDIDTQKIDTSPFVNELR